MSFITVCGEMYHCTACQTVLTVEFTEGMSLLQVGDRESIKQRWLGQRWAKDYFHHEGICQRCYDALAPESVAEAARIIKLINQGRNTVEAMKRDAVRWPDSMEEYQENRQRLRELQKQVDEWIVQLGAGQAFVASRVKQTKNYNPFISYEHTVRHPVEMTPDVAFYFPVPVNRELYFRPLP